MHFLNQKESLFRIIRWGCFAAILSMMLYYYYPMLSYTAFLFNQPIEDMQHGWLVPIVSFFALWKSRAQLRAVAGNPSWGGFFCTLFFLALGWLGLRGNLARMLNVSFIGLLWSVPYALWGRQTGRVLVFPVAFLCFTIPVGTYFDFFTIHLRICSSFIATETLKGLGIFVERSGTSLISHTPGASFNVDVADPCSGIRSLFAMMALSAAYAYWMQKTLFRRWLLFFSSLPIAMAGNIVRIFSICLVATWFGQDVATGFYHDYSGIVIFVIGLMLLFGFSTFLSKSGRKLERFFPRFLSFLTVEREPFVSALPEERPLFKPGAGAYSLLAATLLFAMVAFLPWMKRTDTFFDSDSFVCKKLPENVGSFVGDRPFFCHNDQCLVVLNEHELDPKSRLPSGSYPCPLCKKEMGFVSLGEFTDLPKDTQIRKREYMAADGFAVSVNVVVAGRDRNSIHRAELCLPAQGFVMLDAETVPLRILPGGESIPVHLIRSQKGSTGQSRGLVYWFECRDRRFSSHTTRILADTWDRAVHNRINRWIMVSVSVPCDLADVENLRRLEQFLADLYPFVFLRGKNHE